MTITSSELLTAEIFERAVRMNGVVGRAIKPLMLGKTKVTAQTASGQRTSNLVEVLIVEELKTINKSSDSEESKVEQLRALMEVVAIIHEGALPTIPRLVEPIELHSYLRQSGGAVDLKGPASPLIFATERLGMHIYPNSLAGLLKKLAIRQKLTARARHYSSEISKLAEVTLSKTNGALDSGDETTEGAYVAIPAIDIHNPMRWPSLWHELAHHQLNRPGFNIHDEFKRFVNGDDSTGGVYKNICIRMYEKAIWDKEINLDPADQATQETAGDTLIRRWLVECWCDAFGVRRAGLGFLYSQLHDFMFCWPNYLATSFTFSQPYPPADFRLRLCKNLAIERLKRRRASTNSDLLKRIISAYQEEESKFLALTARSSTAAPKFPDYYSLLLSFFKGHDSLNPNYSVVEEIAATTFADLEDDLKSGLPIPAIEDRSKGVSRAANVSEIVLIGWMVRNEQTRTKILDTFNNFSNGSINRSECIQLALDIIDRSDDSMKRSIQVSEWFSILSDTSSKVAQEISPTSVSVQQPITQEPGLISDHEIRRLIFPNPGEKPTLRVIPLINHDVQLKGTVVDLRLGHNFEIFSNLGQMAIDACDPNIDARVDSLEREVDLLEGLHLLPGQFVLGHTLEYVRLPSNIAAQIEGRSSFARLGIQVHMTANLVEAGFEGCLTLEILNSGPSTVVIYPGMRFAQLRFFRLSGQAEMSYSRSGNKYYGQMGHNRTKQFSDPEVKIFRRLHSERNNGNA